MRTTRIPAALAAIALSAIITLTALLAAPLATPVAAQEPPQGPKSGAMAVPGATPGAAPGAGPAAMPAGVSPESGPQAVGWFDGAWQYSSITNCWSIIQGMPYTEYGAAAYVGFRANPDTGEPQVNQIYYIHVVVGGLGNSCSGQYAYIDVALPPNTSIAVDGTHPIACYYDATPLTGADCPQSLSPNSTWNPGAYPIWANNPGHANAWPIPQGRILEIQIPVRTTSTLSNSPLQANVWMLDGNSSPWLRPQQGVYVFSGAPSTPAINYPSPSTVVTSTTDLLSTAYLYTYGTGGTFTFDVGTTAGYGFWSESGPVPAGTTWWLVWENWQDTPGHVVLQPDTLYHWRLRYTPSGGSQVVGADQTFRTLADGRKTVGTGSAASCTAAAFNTAFTTAKEINFSCGAVPVTITLASTYAVNSGVTINGGNKVTLAGSSTNGLFYTTGSGHLTMTQVTVANTVNNYACGGAVHVNTGGRLTTNLVRFYNNQSSTTGGAVCVDAGGYAEMNSTQVSGNTAATGGGGIANAGGIDMRWSDISGNSTPGNGGGVNNSGYFDAYASLIAGNSANNGTSSMGGGVYDSGDSSLGASTVSGNFANYGGGLTSAGNSMYLTGVTIAYNAGDPGEGAGVGRFMAAGGLDTTNPSGTTVLRNVLLAGNWPGNCTALAFNRYYTSAATNLDDANRCAFGGLGDKVNANAKLGVLANNGGSTRTHALYGGSAAIDTGTNLYCGFYDQRGFMGPADWRPVDGNGGGAVCDIGAFEYRPTVFMPLVRR